MWGFFSQVWGQIALRGLFSCRLFSSLGRFAVSTAASIDFRFPGSLHQTGRNKTTHGPRSRKLMVHPKAQSTTPSVCARTCFCDVSVHAATFSLKQEQTLILVVSGIKRKTAGWKDGDGGNVRRRNVECVQLVLVLHWGPFYPHLDFFFYTNPALNRTPE